MQRCVYAIPSRPLGCTDEMMNLEKDAEESRISPMNFHKKLQVSLSFTFQIGFYFLLDSFIYFHFFPYFIC